jgi:hypothetical protein
MRRDDKLVINMRVKGYEHVDEGELEGPLVTVQPTGLTGSLQFPCAHLYFKPGTLRTDVLKAIDLIDGVVIR